MNYLKSAFSSGSKRRSNASAAAPGSDQTPPAGGEGSSAPPAPEQPAPQPLGAAPPPQPMWGNKPKAVEEAAPPAAPPMPPGMKPMWGNKAPPPQPAAPEAASDDSAAAPAPPPMPPGMKPMWGNKAPKQPSSDPPAAAAAPPPLPPGMKPMWGNKTPAAPEPTSSGSAPPPPQMWGQKAASAPNDGGGGGGGGGGGPPMPMWGQKSGGSGSSGGPPMPMWGRKPAAPSRGESTDTATSLDATPTTTPHSTGGALEQVEGGAAAASTDPASLPRGRIESVAVGENVKPKKVLHSATKQYELGMKLGAGAYAKVKLATDEERNEYAVKIFKSSVLKKRKMWDAQASGFKTAFDDVLREIAIMKKLDHSNVMHMYDVVDDAGANKLYMVMDFCQKGAILDSEKMPIKPEDMIPMEDCQRWFADSVVGLDYLHFQGIVHYDLKPDNILIGNDGRAVIADFGVSKIHPNRGSSGDLTVGSPGTPSYTAPEVWTATRAEPYNGRLADVWSLGITLFGMVFGYLPFGLSDPDNPLSQTELVDAVCAPEEWAREPKDKLGPEWREATVQSFTWEVQVMELIRVMLQKKPANRWSLAQVGAHPWIVDRYNASKAGAVWTKIEVDDEDVQRALGHGHVANFKRTQHGTLWKLTDKPEDAIYEALHQTGASKFLPKLLHTKAVPNNPAKVFVELEDLTHGLSKPCLLDVKMGCRTYKPGKDKGKPRKDLLTKLLKISPQAASEEEKQLGVVKDRYLEFRDKASSTFTLGFRVDLVALDTSFDSHHLPTVHELQLVATKDRVADVIAGYLQRNRLLLTAFLAQIKELRSTLEANDFFQTHTFVRSSLLFVYDGASLASGDGVQTKIRMIDFPRVERALGPQDEQLHLDHRSDFVEGNGEDGYLRGLDNMIAIFEELLEDMS